MTYEEQYLNNLEYILNQGIKEYNSRTDLNTYRVPATQITVDLGQEFPILQSKKVFWKSAIDEILWIMQKQSNKVAELNSGIWNAWTDENGTIGKTYGYQIGQSVYKDNIIYDNQVDYILKTLEDTPSSRHAVIDIWNPRDLSEMNLLPCTYSSVWTIINKKLNCMLVQRSADYPVGVPFDTTQYAVLTHLFARHLNIKPGVLTHVMADSHIYENQIQGVKKQLKNTDMALGLEKPKIIFKETAPTNFWDITVDDINVVNYNPIETIKYEVAT